MRFYLLVLALIVTPLLGIFHDKSSTQMITVNIPKPTRVFGCSSTTVNHLLLVSRFLRNEGYSVPENFTCNRGIAKRLYHGKDFNNIRGFFVHTTKVDLIYLNDKDKDLDYVLIHEIGHYNHFKKVGNSKFSELGNTPIPENLKERVSLEVGDYASTSDDEFVAEVFAMRHYGIKFSSTLNNFYDNLGGI